MMPLETGSNVSDLNPLWPLGSDPRSQGDDHLRLIKLALQNAWPIGSVIINTTGTNPGTYIGGTWVQIAQGRAIVGVGDNGETEWAQGDQRGSETHTLTVDELPLHTHDAGDLVTDEYSHNHQVYYQNAADGGGTQDTVSTSGGADGSRNTSSDAHSHALTGASAETGADAPHNNLQPSEAHFVFERVADP